MDIICYLRAINKQLKIKKTKHIMYIYILIYFTNIIHDLFSKSIVYIKIFVK